MRRTVPHLIVISWTVPHLFVISCTVLVISGAVIVISGVVLGQSCAVIVVSFAVLVLSGVVMVINGAAPVLWVRLWLCSFGYACGYAYAWTYVRTHFGEKGERGVVRVGGGLPRGVRESRSATFAISSLRNLPYSTAPPNCGRRNIAR